MKLTVPEKSKRQWEDFFKRCEKDRPKFDKLSQQIRESFEKKPKP